MWHGILPQKPYDFFLLDHFENDFIWEVSSKHAVQSYVTVKGISPQFPYKPTPIEQETEAMYRQDFQYTVESAKNFNRPKPPEPKRSMQVTAFISHPGNEHILISPKAEIVIPGKARAMSVWVKGPNRKHSLRAVFRQPNGTTYDLFLGKLNFTGWARMESPIPANLQKRDPKNLKRYSLTFVGFKIATFFREEPGSMIFSLDLPLVLTDRAEESTPFERYKDIWK